jgi:translation initiation factor 1 (eIF-1/SUI1)
MTTINNLKTFNKHAADEVVEPKQLLHELQVLCAGSTSIDDKLPKNGRQCDGLEIKVQGNHSATIARLLRDRYGVPEELIETS